MLSDRNRLIKELDDIFRQIIRTRDKVCQRTGKDYDLQVAHYITRSHKRLRWEEDNAVLLNKGIHYYWAHVKYQEFRAFMIGRIGQEKVDYLELAAKMRPVPLKVPELLLKKMVLLTRLGEMNGRSD